MNCFECISSRGTRHKGFAGSRLDPPEPAECECNNDSVTEKEFDYIAENGYEELCEHYEFDQLLERPE